jgi:hypothetical protein
VNPVQQEMVAAAVRAAVDRAADVTPVLRPAIVLDIDPTNAVATCQADGPGGGPFGADVIAGHVIYPGDRVMVCFVAPQGALVLGRRGGPWEPWHVFGLPGEPGYGSGWQAGGNPVGANAQLDLGYTRRGDRVELRGVATRASGVNNNVAVLDQGYWPQNDLVVQASGDLGARILLTIDMATGTLTVPGGTNTLVADGVTYLAVPPT